MELERERGCKNELISLRPTQTGRMGNDNLKLRLYLYLAFNYTNNDIIKDLVVILGFY